MNTKALLAEFVGTYLLALVIFASGGNAYIVGGTVAVIYLLITKISGSHINPAVSLAFYLKGALGNMELLSYMFSQFVGASAAFYSFKAFA
jgi:aquaporin Z